MDHQDILPFIFTLVVLIGIPAFIFGHLFGGGAAVLFVIVQSGYYVLSEVVSKRNEKG